MTTAEPPVFAISGTLSFKLASRRHVRACVLCAQPAFRIFRGVRKLTCRALKHERLSAMFAQQWQLARSASSWSRV